MIPITQAPRSRRQWLEAAEAAELSTLFGSSLGEIETENGQFSAIMIGPKYYVRRVHERFAAAHGFVVVDVRRDGKCPNPITGETNTVSVISYARRN